MYLAQIYQFLKNYNNNAPFDHLRTAWNINFHSLHPFWLYSFFPSVKFVEWIASSLRLIAFYAHHEVVLKKIIIKLLFPVFRNNCKKNFVKYSSNYYYSITHTSGTADFFELQKSFFNVRIFANVKRGFAIPRARIDIATILRQGFDNFEVSPTGCRMQRLPEVVINNLKI